MTNEKLTKLREVLYYECTTNALDRNKRKGLAGLLGNVEIPLVLGVAKTCDEIPRSLSNTLLEAGFYYFAYEIMAGTWKLEQNESTVQVAEEYWNKAAKEVLDSACSVKKTP
nr:uncharacterized protein LOC129266876 [Lytechinus pictus]